MMLPEASVTPPGGGALESRVLSTNVAWGRVRGAQPARRIGEPAIVLPRGIGRCPHVPTRTIVMSDNSPSVTGGNDSLGRRYEELKLAVRYLARRCRCGREEVALLPFDRGPYDIGPVTLTRKGVEALDAGARTPPGIYGISAMGAALADAEILARGDVARRHVLVAMTDFELFDPPDVMERFCTFPGSVHAVVLRAPVPDRLALDPRVRVTQVSWFTPRGAVARAILEALREFRR